MAVCGNRSTYFTNDVDRHAEWIARCMHTRMKYSTPPISTRAILMTLCGNKYTRVMSEIKVCHNTPIHQVFIANNALRSILLIDPDTLSTILQHYHNDCYVTVLDKRMVANIALV
jgi:hypothetical protein